MLKLVKRHLKNDKGLTLIELLAVVVILGIIAAIAIPAIGGLIDNTKKDAHVANATQMINSAKTHVASNPTIGTSNLTLQQMIDNGLVDDMEDPDTGAYDYNKGTSLVAIVKTAGTAGAAAKYEFTVTLIGKERSITAQKLNELDRTDVK